MGVHPAVIVVFHVCRTGSRVFKGIPFDFAFTSSWASRGFSVFDTFRVLRGPVALLRILDGGDALNDRYLRRVSCLHTRYVARIQVDRSVCRRGARAVLAVAGLMPSRLLPSFPERSEEDDAHSKTTGGRGYFRLFAADRTVHTRPRGRLTNDPKTHAERDGECYCNNIIYYSCNYRDRFARATHTVFALVVSRVRVISSVCGAYPPTVVTSRPVADLAFLKGICPHSELRISDGVS